MTDRGARDLVEVDTSTACNPPNNAVTATGSFQATLVNAGANLGQPSPGTIPCAATFDANSGISLGGGKYSGAFNLSCYGVAGESYFGFATVSLAKPAAGTTSSVGRAGSIFQGGTYVWNGQSDVAYEEGPRCGTKQDLSKAWEGQTGGKLTLDTLSGDDLTFHLTETTFTPGQGGLNYKGTGSFKLSGSGAVKIKNL
ncbi:MAG: hypothetical protein IT371_11775 [Deltaproteobacteria bacterium]|nr:hypothetical protein [Deltaproteobacteria bacterium]